MSNDTIEVKHLPANQIFGASRLRRLVSSTEEWDFVKMDHEVEAEDGNLALSGHFVVVNQRAIYIGYNMNHIY